MGLSGESRSEREQLGLRCDYQVTETEINCDEKDRIIWMYRPHARSMCLSIVCRRKGIVYINETEGIRNSSNSLSPAVAVYSNNKRVITLSFLSIAQLQLSYDRNVDS